MTNTGDLAAQGGNPGSKEEGILPKAHSTSIRAAGLTQVRLQFRTHHPPEAPCSNSQAQHPLAPDSTSHAMWWQAIK